MLPSFRHSMLVAKYITWVENRLSNDQLAFMSLIIYMSTSNTCLPMSDDFEILVFFTEYYRFYSFWKTGHMEALSFFFLPIIRSVNVLRIKITLTHLTLNTWLIQVLLRPSLMFSLVFLSCFTYLSTGNMNNNFTILCLKEVVLKTSPVFIFVPCIFLLAAQSSN